MARSHIVKVVLTRYTRTQVRTDFPLSRRRTHQTDVCCNEHRTNIEPLLSQISTVLKHEVDGNGAARQREDGAKLMMGLSFVGSV